jgi:hypothetical protein
LGDSFSAASLKAYVAEFIATLLFVFAGVGSAIAYCELFYYHFASTSSHFSFHFLPHH